MLYYEFSVGADTYKLRLNTRNIVVLEKSLGCNPLLIFGNGDRIPTVTEMVTVLNAALQQYQHNMNIETAYSIFDKFIEEGNSATDFINVILEIYKVSGIIKADGGNEVKNA